RRHRPPVGHLHLLPGRHAVGRAGAPRRHIDLAALRAALAEDLPLDEMAQEARLRGAGREPVFEVDRRSDAQYRLDGICLGGAHCPSSGTKQAMSWISPTRWSRHRTRTRMRVAIFDSSPASTTCSRAVSAPSSLIRAQANGRSNGWGGRGSVTHAQVVTTPAWP